MPLRKMKFITRAMVRAEPETLFVFGDNMAKIGFGGQAMAMRGEPNAVGIPTKWRPSMGDDAFFTDADIETVEPIISEKFQKLVDHLKQGGDVVWPMDGIGTGMAQLQKRAPFIYAVIDIWLTRLEGATGK